MGRYGDRPPDEPFAEMQLPEGRYGERVEWVIEPLLSDPPVGMKKVKKIYIDTGTNALKVVYEQ